MYVKMSKYDTLKYHLTLPEFQSKEDGARCFVIMDILTLVEEKAQNENCEITDDLVNTTIVEYKRFLENCIHTMPGDEQNVYLRQLFIRKLNILFEYMPVVN